MSNQPSASGGAKLAERPPPDKAKSFNTQLFSTPQGQLGAKFTASSILPDSTTNPYLYEIAVKVNELETFDPRTIWRDFLTPIMHQGLCGACYAYAAVSALADRFAIMTMGQIKVNLNPMAVASCMMAENHDVVNDSPDTAKDDRLLDLAQMKAIYNNAGQLDTYMEESKKRACFGNTLFNVARNLYIFGAPTTDCVPLDNKDMFDVFPTGAATECKVATCTSFSGPKLIGCAEGAKDKFRMMYRARHYQYINPKQVPDDPVASLEKVILQAKIDIYKFGSIISGFQVYSSFARYDGKSVWKPAQGDKHEGGHAIKVVGWGKQNGEEYWLCANSWGADWGDKGYFKIAMRNEKAELEQNFMCIYPDFNTDYGSYDFYNLKNFFVESIEDRAAKYQMMPAVDPYYFIPADDLDEITADTEMDKKYLSKPRVRYYELPNFHKFKAGDKETWVTLLGKQYQFQATPVTAAAPTMVVAYAGLGILGVGLAVYFIRRQVGTGASALGSYRPSSYY